MAEFVFFGWTAADLGMSSIFDLFAGGPFTVAGTPETVTISDGPGDLIFDDAPSQPTPDPGADQVAFGDIVLDGVVVIPDGANVWNIGEFTVTNATTGEVGTLIVLGSDAATPVGMASTINLNVGDELTFSNFVINGAEPYTPLVCFTEGTKVVTPSGPQRIEDLAVGDLLETLDNGTQAIRWIGKRRIDPWSMSINLKLRPVRILAGALGNGIPLQDMLVSRQHRILVRSQIAERMFGEKEVLISAIHLTELPGVFVDDTVDEITYFHLLFDTHELITADGVFAESLFTGPEALKSIETEARDELLEIFPEVAAPDFFAKSARHIPPGRRQKKLVARHVKNGVSVVQAR